MMYGGKNYSREEILEKINSKTQKGLEVMQGNGDELYFLC